MTSKTLTAGALASTRLTSRGSLAEARRERDDMTARLLDGLAGSDADRDLDVDELHIAEELARVPWSMGDRQRQSLAFLVVASLLATRSGSTRVPLGGGTSGFLGRLIRELARSASVPVNVLSTLSDVRELCEQRSLDRIVGEAGERMPLIVSDNCLYLHRHFASESRLVDAVRRLSGAAPRIPGDMVKRALDDVGKHPSLRGGVAIELSEEQSRAVESAAHNPLWVISGGPGTGKTSIVVAVLRVLCRLGVAAKDVALAAPTGKAAQRLAESIASNLAGIAAPTDADRELIESPPPARTIHRLLRYSPRTGRFGYHRNRPLGARVIVVDEASMIDLELMDALLTAAGPETSLILLGDADQLPSVEAGAVLRELVLAGAAPPSPERRAFSTRLTRSYRMNEADSGGAAILAAAAAVRSGEARDLVGKRGCFKVAKTTSELSGHGAELLETTQSPTRVASFWLERQRAKEPSFTARASKVYELVDHRFSAADGEAIGSLFAVFERSRLLTAMRRGEAGCETINRALHRELLATTRLSSEVAYYPGEPVLVRQNDYQRDLFNGEQGVVLRVRDAASSEHSFRAVFRARGGGFRALSIDALRGALDLAYAITVHQSQGSEADEIALLLPKDDRPLLSRELVYTGMTRARHWALISGSRAVLRAAVSRSTERFSGIAAGLR